MATNIIRQEVYWHDAKETVPPDDRYVLAVTQRRPDTSVCLQELQYSPKYKLWNVTDKDQSTAIKDVRYWADLTPPQMKGETDG